MKKWMRNAQAAELLNVNVRTIKRWMTRPTLREALLVVRHGKQWRIPRPDYETSWEWQACRRLEEAGINVKSSWDRALKKAVRKCDRYLPESCRLWLAAYVKALERGRVTQKARENMLLLWNTANEVLNPPKPLKRYEIDVEMLKSHFLPRIRERGLSVKSIMHYWPEKRHFDQVRRACTKLDFENMRRELDFYQAYRDELRRRRGKEPKAKTLCRLLHIKFVTHINNTREELPGIVVKPQTREELSSLMQADVWTQMHSVSPRRITQGRDAQGRTFARIEGGGIQFVDLRGPQEGISIRTFRTRYPRARQQPVIANVRRILSAATSIDEKPCTGKTPVRDSAD
jgi:hypothetical protein